MSYILIWCNISIIIFPIQITSIGPHISSVTIFDCHFGKSIIWKPGTSKQHLILSLEINQAKDYKPHTILIPGLLQTHFEGCYWFSVLMLKWSFICQSFLQSNSYAYHYYLYNNLFQWIGASYVTVRFWKLSHLFERLFFISHYMKSLVNVIGTHLPINKKDILLTKYRLQYFEDNNDGDSTVLLWNINII